MSFQRNLYMQDNNFMYLFCLCLFMSDKSQDNVFTGHRSQASMILVSLYPNSKDSTFQLE